MLNVKVCRRCEHFEDYDMWLSNYIRLVKTKAYGREDLKGFRRTLRWYKNQKTKWYICRLIVCQLDHHKFINQDPPEGCEYKLEHMVMSQ